MTLFSLLPDTVPVEDLHDWAIAGAASLALGTDWAEDDAQLERTAFMLESLMGLDRLPGFDLRFLFLAHPAWELSLRHVAIVEPEGDADRVFVRLQA